MKYERRYFTDYQIKELTENKWVKKISAKNVAFTDDFKIEFMQNYRNGTGPKQIFVDHGINPTFLGASRIQKCSHRFRDQYARPEGFSRKENSSKGKPRKERRPTFKSKEEELAYYKEYSMRLEQELDFAKKMHALEEEYSQSASGAGKRK